MAQTRLYLLDTNVLIHDAKAIYNFGAHTVGIPVTVLEELDKFKRESTDRGHAARHVIRELDSLRSHGSLRDGVALNNEGILKIIFVPREDLPATPYFLSSPDNDIILCALHLKKQGIDVRFISKDLNARVKADVVGIPTEDYTKGIVPEGEIYKGWITVEVSAVQLKKPLPDALDALPTEHELAPNEFILAHAASNPYNYRIFRFLGGKKFKAIEQPLLRWPVVARNPQQLMALDLLFDPEVKLINLIGPAGTGKTFLALLAGLYQVLVSDLYRRVLVTRPVIPLGPDIGYLPGDIQEKLRSWMQPMYDTVDLLAHAVTLGRHMQAAEEPDRRPAKKWKRHDRFRPEKHESFHSLDQLAREGKISLEAITYMRGRSIPYQYILIDEVQNLNPHEVKTLVSRVGEGSKIVLAGDPFQIDSPYLDISSNGLVVSANKFRGQKVFGSVFLQTSERSELSKLASELL